jgi:hypothetical protein
MHLRNFVDYRRSGSGYHVPTIQRDGNVWEQGASRPEHYKIRSENARYRGLCAGTFGASSRNLSSF